jgi:hypothetical protein
MACCAFAALLVSQIIVALQAMRRLFGRAPAAGMPAEIMWRLDSVLAGAAVITPAISETRSAQPSRIRLWLFAAVAVECMVLIAGVHWFALGEGRERLAGEFEQLARVRTLAELRDMCGFDRWAVRTDS